MPIYLQQCQRWEKEELNDNQRQWVSTIKEQSTALTIVNEKIIQIARDLSSKTINKILEKSDLEVALDFLSKS
jgi:GTP cyclohydrolase FolE2